MYRDFLCTFYPCICTASSIINIPHQSGSLVTTDEPTLAHHYHPQSITDISSHSWCSKFYEFGQMYNDMYLPLQYHTQQFCFLKNILCSAYLSFSPPQPLVITDLFAVSIILPFPECHVIGIIQYVAFSDWLLSLSNIHLRFLHVFSGLDTLFLFSTEYYFFVWICHSLFIHSPTEGHLGCFQLLDILNKAAVNIYEQVFVQTQVLSSFGQIPRSVIAGSYIW